MLVAAEAFERIARKNYDLMGDLVDYAVAQVKTPANTTNLQEAYEQGVTETKAFAEKVNARAAEYVALAGELGEMAKSKAPAAPKAKASSAKASSVAETAKAAPAKAASVAQTESKAAPAAAKKKAPAKKTAAKSR